MAGHRRLILFARFLEASAPFFERNPGPQPPSCGLFICATLPQGESCTRDADLMQVKVPHPSGVDTGRKHDASKITGAFP